MVLASTDSNVLKHARNLYDRVSFNPTELQLSILD